MVVRPNRCVRGGWGMRCALLLTLALAPAATGGEHNNQQDIHWAGEAYDVADLPESLPAPVHDTAAAWSEWAESRGYRMDLDESGMVIVITPGEYRARDRKQAMKLVAGTVELFEQLFPTPERGPESVAVREVTWGAPQHVPDQDPVVLFSVDDLTSYMAVIDLVVETRPDLREWGAAQRGAPGLVEETGHVAVIQQEPSGIELDTVWRPRNELVNPARAPPALPPLRTTAPVAQRRLRLARPRRRSWATSTRSPTAPSSSASTSTTAGRRS